MSNSRKGPNDTYRYTSIGVQMVLMIGIMAYVGVKLDAYFETSRAFWTAGCAIFGVVAAIVYIVRAVSVPPSKSPKKSEKEKP